MAQLLTEVYLPGVQGLHEPCFSGACQGLERGLLVWALSSFTLAGFSVVTSRPHASQLEWCQESFIPLVYPFVCSVLLHMGTKESD